METIVCLLDACARFPKNLLEQPDAPSPNVAGFLALIFGFRGFQ